MSNRYPRNKWLWPFEDIISEALPQADEARCK